MAVPVEVGDTEQAQWASRVHTRTGDPRFVRCPEADPLQLDQNTEPGLPFALAPEEFRGADRPLPVTIETRASARDVHSARADGGENAPLRRAFAKPRSSRRQRDELPAPFGFGATILFHSGFSGDVGLSGVDRGRALHRGFQQTAQGDQR